jgi:inhibitor of KinA sporulation pathway (predicted exonuclease)
MGHILMDNRNGLVVDVEITHANGTAEHQAALKMLGRQRRRGRKQTVGADKNYDCKAFVQGCRKLGITPHVRPRSSTRPSMGAPSGMRATKPV